MKQKLKFELMFVCIAMTFSSIAQITGYIPKWNGTAYVNTVTPIFEDATNSRIGIGTTTPTYTLDAVKNQNAQSVIRISNSTAGSGAGALFNAQADAYSTEFGNNSSLSPTYGASLANYGFLYTGGPGLTLMVDNNAGIINFATGGNVERMRIASNGNVGIGTTSPAGLLHILGCNATVYPRIEAIANGQNSELGFIGKTSSGVSQAWDIGFNIGTNTSFEVYDRTAGATRFMIDAIGNVGLGTTSPATLLHVQGIISNGTLGTSGTYGMQFNPDASGNGVFNIKNNSGATAATSGLDISTGTTSSYVSRLSINQLGNVGIGTTSPLAKLHLNNGAVLCDGTTGSTPTSGAGTRMMWIPAKGAFRAGEAVYNEWDDAYIGTRSAALGYLTEADGSYSTALGYETRASGLYSSALGNGTTASGSSSTALGANSVASGIGSLAAGGSVATATYSAAFGNSSATGQYSAAFGKSTYAQSYASFVIGQNNIVSGTTGSWVSTDPLFVIGNGTSSPNNAVTVLKNGNVNLSTLAGTGTRMVVSDASGNISTQAISVGDNLGNHTATMDIKLSGNKLTNNGTGGILIDNSGNVGINATAGASSSTLNVGGLSYLQGAVGIGVAPNTFIPLYVNGNSELAGFAGIGGAYDGTLTYKLLVTGNSKFSGNATITGAVTSTDLNVSGTSTLNGYVLDGMGYWTSSDVRYKKNIETIKSPLQKIMKIRGVRYDFNIEKFPNFQERKTIGFIAQELKEVIPEAVMLKSDGYYAVNYQEIIPVLVEAIKEQQSTIDSLKKATRDQNTINKSLQQQINNLVSNYANHGNNISNTINTNVDLSDKNVVVLEQNIPNPFAEQTVINYNLPDNFSRAQIIFLDQSGKLIKAVDLTEKGKGSLNVFASDLTNGIYTYSLIVDGQSMETKKMVKTK